MLYIVKAHPKKLPDNQPTACYKKVDRFSKSGRDEIEMNRTRGLSSHSSELETFFPVDRRGELWWNKKWMPPN